MPDDTHTPIAVAAARLAAAVAATPPGHHVICHADGTVVDRYRDGRYLPDDPRLIILHHLTVLDGATASALAAAGRQRADTRDWYTPSSTGLAALALPRGPRYDAEGRFRRWALDLLPGDVAAVADLYGHDEALVAWAAANALQSAAGGQLPAEAWAAVARLAGDVERCHHWVAGTRCPWVVPWGIGGRCTTHSPHGLALMPGWRWEPEDDPGAGVQPSTLSYVVVRRLAETGRWTAALGIGGATRHLPGSHPDADTAERAGREALGELRAEEAQAHLDGLIRTGRPRYHDLAPWALGDPTVVVLPGGGNAWDALTAQREREGDR